MATLIEKIREAFAKANGRPTILTTEELVAMHNSQQDKKKTMPVWLSLVTETENAKAAAAVEDDDDDEEAVERDTGDDVVPEGEDVTKAKGKDVSAVVRKDAIEAAAKLAADEAFKRDMQAGVAAGKVKRRVAALVALHVRRIFGADNIMGVLPVPGSKAADLPAGSNAPYDLGAKVGEPGWYRSASLALPWVADANKRLGYVNLLLGKESATLPDTPADLAKMSNSELRDEQRDLQDDITGAVSQFRTAARILHRIQDVKELGLTATIRTVKKADGSIIVPKGIQPIKVAHSFVNEDGETEHRDRFFTVGAFLSVKLEKVREAADKFAAFTVERKPRGKNKAAIATVELKTAEQMDMAFAELGHCFEDVKVKADFLSLLNKADSADLVLSVGAVQRELDRIVSTPSFKTAYAKAKADQDARRKVA